MPLLSLLGGPLKSIFTNKYFWIVLIVSSLGAYHYFTVNGLKTDILIMESNLTKTKNALEVSNNTIKSMDTDIIQLKGSRKISENSYIKEIKELKALIYEMEKKPKFKEIIKIKKVKVPVIVGEKTVYIDTCEDIKVHRLDENSSKLLKILSGVGK